MLACAEALAEVRFDGWDASGNPVARPVTAPIIRCFATEENQAGNTYENVHYMLSEGVVFDEYPGLDVGISRVYLPDGGRIVALSSSAGAKDGGLDTFDIVDESHLWVTRELKSLHDTVDRNLSKRQLADGWMLETSTMYAPGENSVAEDTHASSKSVPGVLFDHKQAPKDGELIPGTDIVMDIEDDASVIAALRYVYGPAASWMDLEGIVAKQLRDPKKRESDFRRYYLNQPWSLEEKFIRADEWDELCVPNRFGNDPDGRETYDERTISPIPDQTDVVLAFDGSLNNDWTVLSVITIDLKPHVDVVKTWDPPEDKPDGWSVDVLDVMETIRLACAKWNVKEIAADPARWKLPLETLAAEGFPAVVFPQTDVRMAPATKGLHDVITTSGLTHSGDKRLRQHMLNAVAKGKARAGEINTSYRIGKVTKDSPDKIDLAVTTVMGVDRALSFANEPPIEYARVAFAGDVVFSDEESQQIIGMQRPKVLSQEATTLNRSDKRYWIWKDEGKSDNEIIALMSA